MSTMETAGPERGLPPAGARAATRRVHSRAGPTPLFAHSPEPIDAWSDDAVQQLHEGLLRHALQALHTRGNPVLKQEILIWIFCPQDMVLTLPDTHGRQRATVLPQQCTPFSFEQCCRVCGYSPQRLRDGLAALLPAIGLAELHAQITREATDAVAPRGIRNDARGQVPPETQATVQGTGA
jgi:hypothetical protein